MKTEKRKPSIREYLKQFKIWLAPGLAILVVALRGVIVVKPRIEIIYQKRDERRLQQEKLNQLVTKLDQLENLDQSLYKDRLILLTEALPDDRRFPELIFALEGLARQSGVAIDAIVIKEDEGSRRASADQNKVQATAVAVTIQGRQDQVIKFIKQIEVLRRLTAIEKIQLSQSLLTASPSAAVRASMQLKTFYLPLPSSLGSPEKPLETLSSYDESLLTELRNRLGSLKVELPTGSRPPSTRSAQIKNPFEN